MYPKTFISRKKHLLFIGFEIFAIGLIIILYMNFKLHSVEDISHYNIISIILMAFGAFTFFTGFSKRYFQIFENELVYFNKTEKYRVCYKDIYLIRLFRQGRSSQVILGIVEEDKHEIFEISTSFFDANILRNLALELYEISQKYKFLLEDEVGWLEIDNNKNEK